MQLLVTGVSNSMAVIAKKSESSVSLMQSAHTVFAAQHNLVGRKEVKSEILMMKTLNNYRKFPFIMTKLVAKNMIPILTCPCSENAA